MDIYTCTLDLLEHTFFGSREINAFYQTEPLIGNYALCYALGLCQSPYFNDGTIHYKNHLSKLNEGGIYVTPAKIEGEAKFTITQFNAQSDTYWYKFDQNAITVDKSHKARAVNFPQTGRIKMLALGNRATFYVLCSQLENINIPPYIRLGKFMSKAKVTAKRQTCEPFERQSAVLDLVLNPVDLPETLVLKRFDIVNIHPSAFIKNVEALGTFYELPGKVYLPAGMKFGVDLL